MSYDIDRGANVISESAIKSVGDVGSVGDVARSPTTPVKNWIDGKRAAVILDVEPRVIPRLAALGKIGVRPCISTTISTEGNP
jgi:hypothetical protein